MDSSVEIEERAAEWLARRDGESWSDADESAFQAWLNASTVNRVAYLRLDAVWQQANRLRALGAGLEPGVVPPPGEWRQSPFFESHPSSCNPAAAAAIIPSADEEIERRLPQQARGRRWFARPLRAIAASLLVALGLMAGWHLWPAGPSYRTSVGGLAAVPMIDGSKITLNTDSEVRVDVTDSERRVELTHGEAFFEVAKDPARPFVVEAGNQRFIVVGTKFSVRREGVSNRLVVTEGRVRIESSGPLVGEHILSTVVSAGGIARSGETGVLVQEKAVGETEVMLSWRRGYLVFKDTALADAVAEFNRYNTDKIVIQDASVAGIRIGGNFRSTNVDAFVRLLEDGMPIRVERRDDRIILSQN